MCSKLRAMVERLLYKRDRRAKRKKADFTRFSASVLVLLGTCEAAAAALALSVALTKAAMGRELSWKKFYAGEGGFFWDRWTNARCCSVLHMTRKNIAKISEAFIHPAFQFALPERYRLNQHGTWNLFLRNRCRVSLLEITCIFFARFANAGKYELLAPLLGGFHWSRYKLVFKDTLDAVVARWVGCGLHDISKVPLNAAGWTHGARDSFAAWAAAIWRQSGASPRVVGFIDGTFRTVCKPEGEDWIQRLLYNGYEGTHGLKYQSLCVPCGLIFDMYGPVVGSCADSTILAMSGLEAKLADISARAGWHAIAYADSAYSGSDHILRGCKRHMILCEEHRQAQTAMNGVRTSVEWGFGITGMDWPWVKVRDVHKVKLSPCGLYFKVATILTNIKTCLVGGNLISDYFDLEPPTLAQYLAIAPNPQNQ